MKRLSILFGVLALILSLSLSSCSSGKPGGTRATGFAGKFTDEFNNKFVLNEDFTATIQFAGMDSIIQTHWLDGADHKSPYATIEYNGDHAYFYLRDGYLYRKFEDMEKAERAIEIKYE